MANYLTIKDIAREAIVMTDFLIVFGKTIFRGYEKNFTGGKKIGSSITLRNYHNVKVQKFGVGQKPSVTPQEVEETPTELKLEYRFVAAIEVFDEDLTLRIEDFSEQVLQRGLEPMVQEIEEYALSKLKKVKNYAKKLGTNAPSTLQHLADLSAQATRQKFSNTATRWFLMDPETKASIQGGAPETVTANTRGDSGSAFETANFGKVLGMQGVESNLIPEKVVSTCRAGKTSGVVTASNAEQTINLAGLTSGHTISEGDILEFTNPVAKNVVLVVAAEDKTFGGATDTLLVDVVDADLEANATFTVKNIGFNCIYQEKAFALCVVPLATPASKKNDGNAYYITDAASGYGFRVLMDFKHPSDIIYVECLGGAAHIQHELAFRVESAR